MTLRGNFPPSAPRSSLWNSRDPSLSIEHSVWQERSFLLRGGELGDCTLMAGQSNSEVCLFAHAACVPTVGIGCNTPHCS